MMRCVAFLTVVVLVSACSDPRGTPRPQPFATMSEATAVPTETIETSPTATATVDTGPPVHPTPVPGPQMVDPVPSTVPPEAQAVIDAVAAKDLDALLAVTRYVERACVPPPPRGPEGAGGPPRCNDGDADGTTYRVFLSAGCEGSWTEDARAPLGGVLQYAGPLYAVAVLYEEPDNWVGNEDVYGQYQLVFYPAAGVAQIFAPYVFVADGQIVRTQVGCSTIERGILYRGVGPAMPLVVGPLPNPA